VPTIRATPDQLITLVNERIIPYAFRGLGAVVYNLKSGGGPARVLRAYFIELEMTVQVNGDMLESDFIARWPLAMKVEDIQL
jgi:hypothetical protein